MLPGLFPRQSLCAGCAMPGTQKASQGYKENQVTVPLVPPLLETKVSPGSNKSWRGSQGGAGADEPRQESLWQPIPSSGTWETQASAHTAGTGVRTASPRLVPRSEGGSGGGGCGL